MASSKEYLDYVLERLADPDITYRKMMGEYLIYYQDRLVGGIYDDRFLVKKTKAAERILPEIICEIPYEGAKEMLAVDVDDSSLLKELIPAIAVEVPEKKKKK